MDALQGLPSDALKLLSQELKGETILWAGRPGERAAFVKSLPMLLFAVPWTAFAVAWELLALGSFFNTGVGKVSGPGGVLNYVFPLFGLPFVVVGFGMLSAPAWGAYKARRTVHILTDKRLVSAVLLWRDFALKTILPEKIFDITRQQKADGTGTITFSLGQYRDSDGDLVDKKEVWAGVPDAQTLEARLREVMAAHKGAA